MKEKEFDIYVRNILQNAEEPVSPEVWKGVEAGLNRRPVFPVWAWSLAGLAAAAALVLGVFLFRPAQPEHSNPTISIAETPKATVPPQEPAPAVTEEIAPIEEQVARSVSHLAYVPELTVLEEAPAEPEVPEEPAPEATLVPELSSVPPEAMPESAVEDQEALNRLAYTQLHRKEPRGFSFTAGGNLQGTVRDELPSKGIYRAPTTAIGLLAPVMDGISNEQPELNFSLPFSIGASVKYHFSSRWAVGLGVRYTNMSRTFIGDYRNLDKDQFFPQTDIDNHQHWLGVPLNFYFNIIDNGRWRLHTFVGGATEFLFDNDFLIHASPKDIHYHQRGTSLQWSAAGGLGVEFRLTPYWGLYLDPSVRYYFGTANQPRSIRTIQPLRLEIEAGVRFSFGAK